MGSLKAAQIHLGGPIWPPKYICAALRLLSFYLLVLKSVCNIVSLTKSFVNLVPGNMNGTMKSYYSIHIIVFCHNPIDLYINICIS